MGEIIQILGKKILYLFSKVILAVSKVRHLPHLPALRYGHDRCQANKGSGEDVTLETAKIQKKMLFNKPLALNGLIMTYYLHK